MLDKDKVAKIEGIYRDIMSVHGFWTSRKSEVYETYLQMAQHAMKDGSIPKLYKELIAVGIGAAVNCQPCIAWHITEAVNNGATDEQVIEALQVAMEMGGGPVVARSSFALEVLEYARSKAEPSP